MKNLLSENNKGITLIALVITIIVLLILAGITIAMITGQDSAPEKAAQAKIENDKGAAKDAAALLVTGKIQDYYDGKYVNKTVTDGTILAYLERELSSSNAVTTGEYKVVVADGKITVTKGTETMATGTVSNEGVITWSGTSSGGTTPQTPTEPLEIGDVVNYTTSLNGVTLDNWKVFYIDGDYTYIILDDYLPNAYISDSTTYNLNTKGNYCVYSNSREDLINAMTTKANWDSLLTGSINGHTVSETRTENVWAMGSPTVDLWVNSWNSKYPSDLVYTRYIDTEDIDNNNFYSIGYAIGNSANPTTVNVDLSSKTGYNNTLYFPHQEIIDKCAGYLLASPSAYTENHVLSEANEGALFEFRIFKGDSRAFRPVICLPTSVVSQ